MKYRTKLYSAYLATAFFSSLIAVGILFFEIDREFLVQLRSKVISIAATTAALLDGDALEKAIASQNEESPAFIEVKRRLEKVKNSNRRADTFTRFVYTLYPSPKDPSKLLFAVDAETDPRTISHLGQFYAAATKYGVSDNLLKIYSPQQFIQDQWGMWLSGFAPVYNSQGKFVAVVGVDLDSKDIDVIRWHLLRSGIFALCVSIAIALIVAFALSHAFTRSLNVINTVVKEISEGNFYPQILLKSGDEFEELGNAINKMIKGLRERERLKLNFTRYVSQYILEKILRSETPLKLEGERKKITVLFSDIRSFTNLAEKLSPEQVVSILNEYFGKMLDVIFKNFGTLDKFIGDGIMVEFGAPLDDPMQERHALATAIEMHQVLQKLDEKWAAEGKPRIQIGIGIHTGYAVVGNMGSEKRLEYTAVGDTVNIASRLEFSTKTLQVPILISETTYAAIKEIYPCKSMGLISLPGLEKQVSVYALESLPTTNPEGGKT